MPVPYGLSPLPVTALFNQHIELVNEALIFYRGVFKKVQYIMGVSGDSCAQMLWVGLSVKDVCYLASEYLKFAKDYIDQNALYAADRNLSQQNLRKFEFHANLYASLWNEVLPQTDALLQPCLALLNDYYQISKGQYENQVPTLVKQGGHLNLDHLGSGHPAEIWMFHEKMMRKLRNVKGLWLLMKKEKTRECNDDESSSSIADHEASDAATSVESTTPAEASRPLSGPVETTASSAAHEPAHASLPTSASTSAPPSTPAPGPTHPSPIASPAPALPPLTTVLEQIANMGYEYFFYPKLPEPLI